MDIKILDYKETYTQEQINCIKSEFQRVEGKYK